MNERRVLVLGLDCADVDLIERWIEEGHLPNLANLKRNFGFRRISSTAEVMHVSAWPTLHTGTLPGQHGMYHAYQVRAGNQNILRTEPSFCAQKPFWSYLDDAGRSCIIFDAFMDSPIEDFGGIQVREYGTWTWFGDPGSTPSRVNKTLKSEVGPYPGPEHSKVVTVPDPSWFTNKLIEGARQKAAAIEWLLKNEPWTFAFATFNETHGAAHYLWHHSDEDYPTFEDSGFRTALRDVYAAVDAGLGDVLSAVGDETDVIVVSCDGMGPNYSGCHLMPDLLHRLGLFHGANVGEQEATTGGSAKKQSILSQVRQSIPLEWRQKVTQILPRDLKYRISMKWANTGVDWQKTKVYCIPNNNEAYFRINLHGREPEGIVTGDSAEALLHDLEVELRQLTNPDTGLSAVRSVVRIEQEFPGPELKHLPDLAVTWNNDARTTNKIWSPTAGTVSRQHSYEFAPHYMGNHRPNSFAVTRGPSFTTSASAANESILDIAPTIFDLLNIDPPKHFAGQSWLKTA